MHFRSTEISFFCPEPVVSPCTGDAITLEGTFHFVGRVTYDESGRLHALIHVTVNANGEPTAEV